MKKSFSSYVKDYLMLAVLLSAFNGAMYAWLKVFPFIITLGTQYILDRKTVV